MAISTNKFVDISTVFPDSTAGERAFGGLVITSTEEVSDAALTSYTYGDATYKYGYLSLAEVETTFGSESDEYTLAERYYEYISPSGRFAAKLMFMTYTGGEGESLLEDALKAANSIPGISGFGSVTFLSHTAATAYTEETTKKQLKKVAEYNDATLDCKYLLVLNYVKGDSTSTEVTTAAGLFKEDRGVCFVAGHEASSAYMPMAILAAIDYTDGVVTNFMFKQFEKETAAVIDDTTYSEYNKACINFYGQTQMNGQTLAFYQRGYNTDGTDTSYYCNDMWFKSACEQALMNLLIKHERVPASTLGVDMVKLEVIDICSQAVINGAFMAKDIDTQAKKQVRAIIQSSNGTAEDVDSIEADISSKGYSVYAYLGEDTVADDDTTRAAVKEPVIVYYVFYGTADGIRFIKGNNILLV